MQSPSPSEDCRRRLLAVGTAHFEKLEDQDLSGVPEEVERIAAAFKTLGYKQEVPSVIDPNRDELQDLFAGFKNGASDGDVLVAYYTTHGVKDPERFYVLTNESNLSDLDRTALSAEDLARLLIKGNKASQVLVILDACYAAAGASEFAQVTSRLRVSLDSSGGPTVFILAAARPKQEAAQGALSHALGEALANEKLGGCLQPYFYLDQIVGEIESYLKQKHPSQVASWDVVNYTGSCRVFPNPRYRPFVRPGMDLESQRAFEEHWVPKARGAELGINGWYFTGREQALKELSAWLHQASSGERVRVVTGGPGCGKSALLARIVMLSASKYRSDVLATVDSESVDSSMLPPENVVNIAIHARHKLLRDIVDQISAGLNLKARNIDELIQELQLSSEKKTVIVIDALDEADEKEQIVSRLLLQLVRLPHVFLLVGTRPDSSEQDHRFRELGDHSQEIDLDDPYFVDPNDVTRYVERRLLATEEPKRVTVYQNFPKVARTVAQAVSERAKNNFLVAHTAVLSLLSRRAVVDLSTPDWVSQLPTGIDASLAIFLSDLDAHPSAQLTSLLARSVLRALAFAEGEGLPWLNIWARVSTEISNSPVDDTDIALVREHAAAFIVEAIENGGSVYRLFHECVAEYLRSDLDITRTQQSILVALHSCVPAVEGSKSLDWFRAHPYIRTYFATHAHKASALDTVLKDPGFVIVADPHRLGNILATPGTSIPHTDVEIYLQTLNHLTSAKTDGERASYLELTALQMGEKGFVNRMSNLPVKRTWQAIWAYWRYDNRSRVLARAPWPIHASVFFTLERTTYLIMAGRCGIRIQTIETGRVIDIKDIGSINSVTATTLKGQPVVIGGGQGGALHVWNLETGEPVGISYQAHFYETHSLASIHTGDLTLVVSGGYSANFRDGEVHVWNLQNKSRIPTTIAKFNGIVKSIATGTLNNKTILAIAGYCRKDWPDAYPVIVVDAQSGSPIWIPPPPLEDTGITNCIALMTTHNGESILIVGADHSTLSVWSIDRKSNLINIFGPNLFSWVTAATTGEFDGQSFLAGAWGNIIQIWNMDDFSPISDFICAHEDEITSMSFVRISGRPALVSASLDAVIRIWFMDQILSESKKLSDTFNPIRALHVANIRGQPMVWFSESDSIRCRNAETGEPAGEELHDANRIATSIAIGVVNENHLVLTGTANCGSGDIRAWDIKTRRKIPATIESENNSSVGSIAVASYQGQDVFFLARGRGGIELWDRRGVDWNCRILENQGYEDKSIDAVVAIEWHKHLYLIGGGSDNRLSVWNVDTGKQCFSLYFRDHINDIKFRKIGDRIFVVSGGDDCIVWLWELVNTLDLNELSEIEKDATFYSKSNDYPFLHFKAKMVGHYKRVAAVALLEQDGKPIVVSGSKDRSLRVWKENGDLSTAIDLHAEIYAIEAIGQARKCVVATTRGLLAVHIIP